MFGWRARIGYLCPSVFEMIAYDFYRIVPPGVGMIGVTCMIEGWQADAYRTGWPVSKNAPQSWGGGNVISLSMRVSR